MLDRAPRASGFSGFSKSFGAFNLPAAVALATLAVVAWFCAPLYFAGGDHLEHERLIITALLGWQFWCRLRRPLPGRRLQWHAAWTALPAAAALVASFTLVLSKDLAIYSGLVYGASVLLFIGGTTALKRCWPLFFAAACMVYPPQRVYDPLVTHLLLAVVQTSAWVCHYLLPTVQFSGLTVLVGGEVVDFVSGCSGNDFMMTYAALALVVARPDAAGWRLLFEVAGALALGFALNVARIVTMLALTQMGQRELALGYGHLALGEAFVFVGIMVILWRAERPAAAPASVPLV